MIIDLQQHLKQITESPRTEDEARIDKALTDFLALKLIIDVEVERINRWYEANYKGPQHATDYAGKVMAAFGRIVETRRRSKP